MAIAKGFHLPRWRAMPVELAREEAHVEYLPVEDRPEVDLGPGAFQEGTIRVPVRGEEVVVKKRAVLANEVVVRKQRTTHLQDVADVAHRSA